MERCMVALFIVAAALVGSSSSASATRQLFATVGPGSSITLRDAAGRDVRRLRPGTYELVVRDRSSRHSFHLSGRTATESSYRTGVRFVGSKRWKLRLDSGIYRYRCDSHPRMMAKTLRVL
jgi:hypothetical protein